MVNVYGPTDLMVDITSYNQFTWYQSTGGGDVSVGERIYNNWLPQNYFHARYMGGPSGASSLLAFDNSQITLGTFDGKGRLAVNGSWTYSPFQPGEPNAYLDPNTFQLTPDMDGDGMAEVMFTVQRGKQVTFPGGWTNYYQCPYVYVLSSKTGAPLINFSTITGSRIFTQMDIVSADGDLDGDKKADLLLLTMETSYDQKDQQEVKNYILLAISSATGALVWEHDLGLKDISMEPAPLAMVPDKNADGSSDVVIFRGKGLDITIDTLSGRTGKIISTGGFKFERNAPASFFESLFRDMGGEDYNAVTSVSTMGDVTGDGVEDFALILGIDDGQMEFVDGASLKSIKTIYTDNIGVLSTKDIDSDGHDDVLLYYNSQFFMLSGGFSIHITSPSSGSFDSGAISVRWDLTAPCEVLVDGISHGYFTGGKADLDLSGGTHQVTVRYRDEFGSVMKDSIKVSIAKSPWPTRINYIAAALGVLIILGYIVFSIVRWSMIRSEAKKRALKSMASQEDHKKMEEKKHAAPDGEAKKADNTAPDKKDGKPEKSTPGDKTVKKDRAKDGAVPDPSRKKAPQDAPSKKGPGNAGPKKGGGSDE